jgi:hypothetical protein
LRNTHGIELTEYSTATLGELKNALQGGKLVNLSTHHVSGSKDIGNQLLLAAKESKNREMIRQFYLFLLTTNQSYRVVENEHLRAFLKLSGAPKEISSISRKTVPRRFESLYEISKKDLKAKLARQDAVSISCDCWSSPSMKQYLCIIVHFTDDNYTYSEYLLDFVKTTADHIQA